MAKFEVGIRNKKTGEKINLVVIANNVDEATHSLVGKVIGPECEYEWLGSGPHYE